MRKMLCIVAMLALVCAVAFAGNLIKFGDMETGSASDWIEEGSSLKIEAGKGVNGSKALLVKNTEDWSGVGLDLTKILDRTKSYYIECWFKLYKAEKNPVKASITLEFSPNGRDGEWTENAYIQTSIDFDDYAEMCTGNEIAVPATEFVKVSGVIRNDDMEHLFDNEGDEILKNITNVTCYFKIEPAKARRYWIDNVIVEEIPNV